MKFGNLPKMMHGMMLSRPLVLLMRQSSHFRYVFATTEIFIDSEEWHPCSKADQLRGYEVKSSEF
jgi:hypothetical protein